MSDHPEVEASANALLREVRLRSSLARRVLGFLVTAILLISSAACDRAADWLSRVSGTPPTPTNTARSASLSVSPGPTLTSTSGSSRPAVPTPDPLTPAETAIDNTNRRTLVPQSTLAFRFEESTMNGVFYPNALVMGVGSRPGYVEINAGRSRSRFLGELGVPDDQRSESSYQVDVSFDNAAPVLSTEVRFGETRRLDLDVTNVLRIRISVSAIAGSRGNLAIGNLRFR